MWARSPTQPISFSFHMPGLVISGGPEVATSIETFPDANCNIPPFPQPGNPQSFSSFNSPPKGETATPSLSLTTVGNLSPAEGTRPRRLASLGEVAKINGLTTQHCGHWRSSFILWEGLKNASPRKSLLGGGKRYLPFPLPPNSCKKKGEPQGPGRVPL